MKEPRLSLTICALLWLLANVGEAQSVHGTVIQDGSPVQGALVSLVDSAGGRATATLSNSGGAFILTGFSAGEYRVQAERIGSATYRSDPFRIGVGERLQHRISLVPRAIVLDRVIVQSERRCVVRPSEGLLVHRIWEEARRALEATEWSVQAFNYRIRSYERDLDPTNLRVVSERSRTSSGTGTRPFSSRSPGELLREGFVQPAGPTRIYHAPEPRVLLSDEFLDSHCFRMGQRDPTVSELVPLEFEPVRNRGVPDIKGTLWINHRTGELTDLDFSYVGIDAPAAAPRPAGRMVFERLDNGAWIVRRWWIRMPALGRRGHEDVLLAVREAGGEVVDVWGHGISRSEAVPRAVITGVVKTSSTGAPVPEATVFLSGTQHQSMTDANGRFILADVSPADYQISFTHSGLAVLGRGWRAQTVSVGAGDSVTLELAMPSETEVVALICPDQDPGREMLLAGVVRSSSGRAAADVPLEVAVRSYGRRFSGLTQTDGGARVTTDGQGRYRACGIPLHSVVEVSVAGGTSRTIVPSVLHLEGGPLLLRDLEIADRTRAVDPIEVPGVTVTASSTSLDAARARGSRMSLLTRAEIEPLLARSSDVSQLLRAMRIPGFVIRDDVHIADGPLGGMRRGLCVQSARAATGGDSCAMVQVYLNGVRLPQPESNLSGIDPETVQSIEFLSAAEAGARYGTGSANGVLLIQTRSGG